MGPSEALVRGLFAAIDGISAANGFTAYTARPQAVDGAAATVFPHVQIGVMILNPFDTYGEIGFDWTVRLHTRWRGQSELPGRGIQDALYARLHRGALSLTDWRLILMDRQSSDLSRIEDGSFHGVCEYRGLIEQI